MASTSRDFTEKLQTCAGIGWVKFDRGMASTSPVSAEAPAVKCLGLRLSQPLAPAESPAGGARTERDSESSSSDTLPAARGRGMASPIGGDFADAGDAGVAVAPSRQFVKVADPTWALVCVGRLSMLARPGLAGGGAQLRAASGALPCDVRCDGLSFRLEQRIMAEAASRPATTSDEEVHAAKPPLSVSAAPLAAAPGDAKTRAPAPAPDGERGAADQDVLQGAYRGAEAVVTRAGVILRTVKLGVDELPGPERFAGDAYTSAVKICRRAVKIVGRSAELVASVPTRVMSGGAADGAGADGGEEPPVGRGGRN